MSNSFWRFIVRPLNWLTNPENQVETQLAYEWELRVDGSVYV